MKTPASCSNVTVVSLLSLALASAGSAQEIHPLPDFDEGALGTAQPLVVRDSEWSVESQGPVYQATLDVEFRNPRTNVVEAVCYLPCPDRAAGRGFLVDNGGQIMRGEVRSYDRAIRTYRRITREPRPRDPAILERINDDWLRVTVAPVAPHALVRVSVSFVGLADRYTDVQGIHLPAMRARGPRGAALPMSLVANVSGEPGRLEVFVPDHRIREQTATASGQSLRAQSQNASRGWSSLWFRETGAATAVRTYSYQTEEEGGFFLCDVDLGDLLSERLPSARYLAVLEKPHVKASDWRQVEDLVDHLQRQLGSADHLEILHQDRLDPSAIAAAARNLSSDPPVPLRILVFTSSRGERSADKWLDHWQELGNHSSTAALVVTVGPHSLLDSTWDVITREIGGRVYRAPTAAHLAGMAQTVVEAVQRPVLRHPQIQLRGGDQLVTDSRQTLTYGDRLTLKGRYSNPGTALIRLRGYSEFGTYDEMFATSLEDNSQDYPWVATLWCADRVRELSRAGLTDGPHLNYLTRLAERYGILCEQTVAIALESELEFEMPMLVGSLAGAAVALAAEVLELPPQPVLEIGETRGERTGGLGNLGLPATTGRGFAGGLGGPARGRSFR
jgi:hypothetical protein